MGVGTAVVVKICGWEKHVMWFTMIMDTSVNVFLNIFYF